MYAEFATSRLIDFLRASSSYNLEMVSPIVLLIMFFFDCLQCTGVQNMPRARFSTGDGFSTWANGEQ
jgi:hypothetical protein